jgi:nitrile hydratase accessory protein
MPNTANLDTMPLLPRDDDGPVFAAPWEAHAFALAVRLSEAGHFDWSEWTAFLIAEIRAAQSVGDPDPGTTYYQHWLRALERLCIAKGLIASTELDVRREDWRQAYLHTPHGKPVEVPARRPARGV